jgi:hypothetical protein
MGDCVVAIVEVVQALKANLEGVGETIQMFSLVGLVLGSEIHSLLVSRDGIVNINEVF